MCGIIASFGKYSRSEITRCTDIIRHRGPDDIQYCFLSHFGCGFVRLSIIDVDGGKQPISNEDNTLSLVCNGEIYNYKDLRDQLKDKHTFKTESDVEVILHLYEDLGIKCIDKLEGMYAFIIYDSIKDRIIAGRDHIGIKPLFYRVNKDSISFSSELKAFDLGSLEKNKVALIEKEVFGFPLDTTTTIYKGIYSVKPGTAISIDYTDISNVNYYSASYCNSTNSIEDALLHSIETHLINADVDVGIALSGGLDSALIAVLAKQIVPNIQTFVIANRKDSADVYYSNLLAKKYGFKHTEFIIEEPEIIKNLNYYLDDVLNHDGSGVFENIGDIAVFLFYREVSKHVKVIISGDGGDELFGGYWMHKKPLGFKDKLKARCKFKTMSDHLEHLFPETNENLGKMNVLKLLFESALPNYHLWTLDRCSMHFGVEARVPYLDINLINTVLQKEFKQRIGKKLLAKLYYKYLPQEIISRDKIGFVDAFKKDDK